MKRIRIAALLMAMALLLCGCSIGDVESQLRAPRPTGEQQAIQQALDGYLVKIGNTRDYTLKYPQDGDYLSAFVMEDIDGDGQEEAIAFYRFEGEGEKTHLHLLKKADGQWQSVSDAEGQSADISGVSFGDLDGDGRKELLAGWSVYNSRDRQLGIYSLGNTVRVLSDDQYYTKLVVDDFVENGRDDLLLFQVDATQNSGKVRFQTLENGRLLEMGQAPVDGYIRGFTTHRVGWLNDEVRGVFVDCQKDAGTTITELIYWDGESLQTPFYNPDENITTLTARETPIPCMTVDGVGEKSQRVAWPVCSRLPGYEDRTATEAMWLTEWMWWDPETDSPGRLFGSVVNLTDKYYLQIPDGWFEEADDGILPFTAVYTPKTHQLSLCDYDGEEIGGAFLSIQMGSEEELQQVAGEYMETVDAAGNRLTYKAAYNQNDYNLDGQKVQYMVRPLF